MKTLPCFLFVLSFSLASTASQPALMTVKQPIYWNLSATEAGIKIADVIVATGALQAESPFNAISLANKPASVNTAVPPTDINLTSLYGIKVTAEQPDSTVLKVTIDASEAQIPKEHSFTIAQVIDATATCVKLMHPGLPEKSQKFELKIIEPGKK